MADSDPRASAPPVCWTCYATGCRPNPASMSNRTPPPWPLPPPPFTSPPHLSALTGDPPSPPLPRTPGLLLPFLPLYYPTSPFPWQPQPAGNVFHRSLMPQRIAVRLGEGVSSEAGTSVCTCRCCQVYHVPSLPFLFGQVVSLTLFCAPPPSLSLSVCVCLSLSKD